jgi:hypothetical protein
MMAGAAILFAVLHTLGFQRRFVNDAEGVGVLLQIIGTLYSVVYAFATYVIWQQFTSVENEILKESGALQDLVLFSSRLKLAAHEPIVRAVKVYARAVVETEWQALARNDQTEKTNRLFRDIISGVIEATAENETERMVYSRLLEIANQASTHRAERLALSAKRMPRTLLVFVTLTACMILFLFFFYPFRSLPLGLVSFMATTMLLFLAQFVLTDLDNPFEGTWNVDSGHFADLFTKSR